MAGLLRTTAMLVCWALLSVSGAAAGTEGVAQPNRRIEQLIQQLGDERYAVRQRAQQELSKLGFDAFDALSEAAEKNEDLEIRNQAEYLVRQIRVQWIQDSDPPQVKEILKDYEFKDKEQRKLTMRRLLDELNQELSVEWLCRLARFEPSQDLSKSAALLIINQEVPAEPAAWQVRSKTIAKVLDKSARPAAAWLQAYVQSRSQPAKALAAWTALVTAEERTLEVHPELSDPAFIAQLLRQQVGVLDQLGRKDDALSVMRKMVRLERGNPQTLVELVEWLAARQAWTVIDEVATRFASVFDADSWLLYTLAVARSTQGNEKLAEEAAQKAVKLSSVSMLEHVSIALRLQQRGLMKWSDREFYHVIAGAPVASGESLQARLFLSESLHDRRQDLEAAQSLKGATDLMDKNPDIRRSIEGMLVRIERDPDSLHSRMNFFLSENYLRAGDRAKQTEHLDKAIEQDPTDADVLIALFRLPDQNSVRRARTKEQIQRAAKQFRGEIDENPNDPTPYNQLAWLIANTEGNFDEAVQLSHHSIELRRAGGFLDTLGRCYFAKGDYANAVKYQAEAHKLDPHSQQIGRQLKIFRQKLAEQKKPGS